MSELLSEDKPLENPAPACFARTRIPVSGKAFAWSRFRACISLISYAASPNAMCRRPPPRTPRTAKRWS